MTLKNKATLLAAVIGVGLIALGTAWKERTRVEPTDYLTFERVVYSGDSLWSLCERYSGYEDIQTIIQRVRDDNGIDNPGTLQPGQKIKVRVRKGGRWWLILTAAYALLLLNARSKTTPKESHGVKVDWVYAPKLKSDGRNQPAKPAISLARSEVGAVQKSETTEPARCFSMSRLYRTLKGARKTAHLWNK